MNPQVQCDVVGKLNSHALGNEPPGFRAIAAKTYTDRKISDGDMTMMNQLAVVVACSRPQSLAALSEFGDIEFVFAGRVRGEGLAAVYRRGLSDVTRPMVLFLDELEHFSVPQAQQLMSLLVDDIADMVGLEGYACISITANGAIHLGSEYNSVASAEFASLAPAFWMMRSTEARSLDWVTGEYGSADIEMADICLRATLWRRMRVAALGAANPVADSPDGAGGVAKKFAGFFPITVQAAQRWQANFKQLQAFLPNTAAMLKSDVRSGVIKNTSRENETLLVQVADSVLNMSECEQRLQAFLPQECNVFMGIGSGDRVDYACRASLVKQVLVIEPEVQLLRNAMTRFDWSAQIKSRRLSFSIPSLLNGQFAEISLRDCVNSVDALNYKSRGNGAAWEGSASTSLNEAFYSAIVNLEETFRDHKAILRRSSPMAAKFMYDVTVVSPACHIFNDVASACHRMGLNTRLLSISDSHADLTGTYGIDAIRNLVEQPSRLTLFRNRSLIESVSGSQLANAEALIPGVIASWWWDVPNVASFSDYQTDRIQWPAFSFAKDILPILPPGSTWLPPGALSRFVDAGAVAPGNMQHGVTFVGQSRIEMLEEHLTTLVAVIGKVNYAFALNMGKGIAASRGMVQLYRYLTSIEGSLRKQFDTAFGHLPRQRYFLNYLLQMSLTAAFRMAAIERLAQAGVQVEVFGDEGWVRSGVVDQQQFRGVIATENLATLYRSSHINLNLNFMQVSSTVNPKVLDICAAGGAVLTDYRPELDVLFPDPNCRPFVFDEIDALPDIVNDLMKKNLDEHRYRVGKHVRQHHCLSSRVLWLAEHFGLLKRESKAVA